MSSEGYLEAGYQYIIIDDCWMEMKRDPDSNKLVADRDRFPSGIKALADYVSVSVLPTAWAAQGLD